MRLFVKRQSALLGLGIAALFAIVVGPGSALGAARVTASTGTTSGGEAVVQHGEVGDDAAIETEDDGGCAMLVDEDALMELCGGTSMRIERKGGKPDGPRIVRLERGEIRMVVEPRLQSERIEVHTPAAIATIVGTVFHMSVENGKVKITATTPGSEILITPVDGDPAKGSLTLRGGEQVELELGDDLNKTQKVRPTPDAMAALGGCLLNFQEQSLEQARTSYVQSKIQEATNADIPGDNEPVSLGLEADQNVDKAVAASTTPDYSNGGSNSPLEPTDTRSGPELEFEPPLPPVFEQPDCGGGLLGEGCGGF